MHPARRRHLCKVAFSSQLESHHLRKSTIPFDAFPSCALYCHAQLHSYTTSIFWKGFPPAGSSSSCRPQGYHQWAAREGKWIRVKTNWRKLINGSYLFCRWSCDVITNNKKSLL